MKEYRSPTGERRLRFYEEEIEWMMEDELRTSGLLPSGSGEAPEKLQREVQNPDEGQ